MNGNLWINSNESDFIPRRAGSFPRLKPHEELAMKTKQNSVFSLRLRPGFRRKNYTLSRDTNRWCCCTPPTRSASARIVFDTLTGTTELVALHGLSRIRIRFILHQIVNFVNFKMAMGKSYKVWHKNNTHGPYSVLLEQRNRDEALLFESLVVASLGKSTISAKSKLCHYTVGF